MYSYITNGTLAITLTKQPFRWIFLLKMTIRPIYQSRKFLTCNCMNGALLNFAGAFFMVCTSSAESLSYLTFSQDLGWSMTIKADGSAAIQYGSSVGDDAETSAGIFDLAEIGRELQPVLLDGSVLENKISVSFREEGESLPVNKQSEELVYFQRLFRKGVLNAIPSDGGRFRGLLQDRPPFGIKDLKISDDQIWRSPPIISTQGSKSDPPQNSVETGTQIILGNPHADEAFPDEKPLVQQQSPSAGQWSVVALVMIGLVWLFLKRRK